MIDLLVAGAGPVGLFAAITAAEAGLKVSIIEPHLGVIDKACGEGLMPAALANLASIGINPAGIDFYGIRYLSGAKQAEARFSHGPGRGVRRTILQGALLERAKELGVTLIEGKVKEIIESASSLKVEGVETRYLIAADGLHSSIRYQMGAHLENKKQSSPRYGLRQHFVVAPWSNFVEVYWLPDCEIYITPVDVERVGVAILGRATLNFQSIILKVPELSERLAGAAAASKLLGAGPLLQQVKKRVIGRVLLVGDAAGYVDALTGEGLSVGFAEAKAAVQALLQNDPKRYEKEWQKITRSYRRLAGGLLWASSNRALRPLIVPAAQTMPSLFRTLISKH